MMANSNGVKITSFEAENVKRIKAVSLEPSENGLTVIGGRNGQGKTSVLDAIAWALGGNRHRPTNAKREGSTTDPHLRVVLSNGIVVERKGVNSSLKVVDPEGRKSGQSLLDSFLEQLALDLPKFLNSNDKDKAETLLQIIGIGDELAELDAQASQLYNQRTAVGQMERQKRSAAEEMRFWPDAPLEPISAAELIERQQGILARNGENQRKREQARAIDARAKELGATLARLYREQEDLAKRINRTDEEYRRAKEELEVAGKSAEELQDESTSEIEESIRAIDETNAKVRENIARASAMAEADALKGQYDDLSEHLEGVRAKRTALLDGADLPLPGLNVNDGVLTYNGQAWDGMSGSEQLRVATAIVRRLNPACGFVLVDKLEQFDAHTLAEFGAWAQSEGLQVIGTRVSSDGADCQIVIEDGYGTSADAAQEPQPRYSQLTTNTTAPKAPEQNWSL